MKMIQCDELALDMDNAFRAVSGPTGTVDSLTFVNMSKCNRPIRLFNRYESDVLEHVTQYFFDVSLTEYIGHIGVGWGTHPSSYNISVFLYQDKTGNTNIDAGFISCFVDHLRGLGW